MKRLITLLCIFLPLIASAEVIKDDFSISGKAICLIDQQGEIHELKDGCTFSLKYSTFGSAGTITKLEIKDNNGDTAYYDMLTDKEAVYLPANNGSPYVIAIISDIFIHIMVYPDTGLISIHTQPYK